MAIALMAGIAAVALHARAGDQQAAAKPAPQTAAKPLPPVKTSPGAGPVIVVETGSGGIFQFETYPQEAPKAVEHIVALVKRNFYNGQKFHRVVPNFMVQWGDPQTRDNRLRAKWGYGNSGKPLGVVEISKTRKHRIGSVAMSHGGNPKAADSQIYVITGSASHLDGKHSIFGQVVSGMDVVQKIKQDDVVRRMTIRADTPPAK
jgi:peptidyl-prolyl cis-trans isomerase B (cyclophilin B)